MKPRYELVFFHGEGPTIYYAVDTHAQEQPAVVESWSTRKHPDAYTRAMAFVLTANGQIIKSENAIS
jgi:glutathionylspermidine synthase